MGNSNSCIYNYCKAEDGKGQEKEQKKTRSGFFCSYASFVSRLSPCHPRSPSGPVCVMECNAIREFHTLFCDFSAG